MTAVKIQSLVNISIGPLIKMYYNGNFTTKGTASRVYYYYGLESSEYSGGPINIGNTLNTIQYKYRDWVWEYDEDEDTWVRPSSIASTSATRQYELLTDEIGIPSEIPDFSGRIVLDLAMIYTDVSTRFTENSLTFRYSNGVQTGVTQSQWMDQYMFRYALGSAYLMGVHVYLY